MKRVITQDGGYWEDDKTRVQPVPGTSIVPALGSALAAAQSRIAKLERMVEWCVEGDVDGSMILSRVNLGDYPSVVAAVEKAMDDSAQP